jgi:hypothetical protein
VLIRYVGRPDLIGEELLSHEGLGNEGGRLSETTTSLILRQQGEIRNICLLKLLLNNFDFWWVCLISPCKYATTSKPFDIDAWW